VSAAVCSTSCRSREIIKVVSPDTFEQGRSMPANAIQTVKSKGRPECDHGAGPRPFAARRRRRQCCGGKTPRPRPIPAFPASSARKWAKSDRPELTLCQRVIVSGGPRHAESRGETLQSIIEPLADKLGAGVRRLARRGSMPAMRRTTGRSARPATVVGARTICRDRDLRRDPASWPAWKDVQGDRRDQQG